MITLILTVFVAAVAGFYMFLLDPLLQSFNASSGDVEEKQTEIDRLIENLDMADKIDKNYKEISSFIEESSANVDGKLTNILFSITRKVGINQPTIDPKDPVDIKDVPGYREFPLEVKLDGEYTQIIYFLEEVEKNGFIVKSLALSANLNDDSLNLYAKFARIIPTDGKKAGKSS